ncbi:Gfo/Idh/MocA family protein [Tenuibacillus multivorans]|uniref:Predicted dehydrogenase n=1 Tax=Tenuibacillus multivorans TaxID=237069 RepID=A0A1H0C2F5_9BACI|nr:Gfo/Idh/MocA family oxidoreductase [Tenuibacillus multivorans]GEL77740.1 oxidoreductase [Tenuibacillus multivorans]SDN52043.1 Predicted dehydrogenase [Tenuibacillus multivorans]
MPKVISFATVGTGKITRKFIEAASHVDGIQLYGVHSRSEDKANQFALDHGVERYYTDLNEMAEEPEIDCVYIASPNSLHYEQAQLFLSHGKHVICEKPMFTTTKEWELSYRLAEQKGVKLLEAVRNIYTPNFERLADQLHQIGQIRSAYLHRNRYSSRYDQFLEGHVDRVFTKEFAGGALMDLGVYPLTLAIALFGEPQASTYFPTLLRSGVDGAGTLVLQYEDFNCTIMCSKISTSYNQSEIHGEKGTIAMDQVAPISKIDFIDLKEPSKNRVSVKEHELDMIYEIQAFVDMMNGMRQQQYEENREIHRIVVHILEKVRRENQIDSV